MSARRKRSEFRRRNGSPSRTTVQIARQSRVSAGGMRDHYSMWGKMRSWFGGF